MISLLAVALAAVALPPPTPRIASVAIVVHDRAGERAFYTDALGFRYLSSGPVDGGTVDRLALGAERVDLVHYDRDGAPIALAARSDDRDFQHLAIIVSDMDRAWRHVSRFAIRTVSASPQVLPRSNPAAGGIAAVYFRDPEGHPLELLHFPADKGAPRWHASAPLFLGIDHTAIAVTDSAASTRFYEALGLTVRGHSDNFGIEQQRLSGVRRAHVAITGLRFGTVAPGIEFLEYRTPKRPQPPERALPPDRVATRTVLLEPSAGALCAAMPAVARGKGTCLVRDPDGHLVELRTP